MGARSTSTSSDDGMITGINVTPLVDITLVLLVVFIVTAKIVVAPAIPLDLPKASSGDDTQVIFSVLMPADGQIMVNSAPIKSLTALQSFAKAEHQKHPNLRAVIQADGRVKHERVIAVLDSLKKSGILKIAFGTANEVGKLREIQSQPTRSSQTTTRSSGQ